MILASVCYSYLHVAFILLAYLYFQLSLNILMLSLGISALLVAIPCFVPLFKEVGFALPSFVKSELCSDIKLGFPVVLNFVVDFIMNGSDRYIIALFMSLTAVGYYNPAYTLGSLLVFLPQAMGTVVPQLLCRAVDTGEEQEAHRMVNYMIRIFLILAIPFTFGSIVVGKSLLSILANAEVAENARFVTPLVALGTLFYSLNIILSKVLYVRLKTFAMFKITVFASVFNFISNMILIYLFRNIVFAAVSTLLSYFLSFVIFYRTACHDRPIDFMVTNIIKSIASSLVMVSFLFWFSSHLGALNPVVGIIFEISLGVFIYSVCMVSVRAFSAREWAFVKNLVGM